jgi:hypothetical protein
MYNMEEVIKDYLWYEYEGTIMGEMYKKYIRWKIDYKGQKLLVDKLFRHEDVKEFYKISMAIFNISNIFKEEWIYNDLLIERYKTNKEQCDEHYIDMLNIEYILWRFNSGMVNFRLFLEILENGK